MASERLQVVLELITGNYKREAQEAARATRQIDDSAKSAKGGVGGLKSSLDSSVGSLKALAGGAAIGAAVVGLGKLKDFANQSIDSYSNLNESINAVNVSFGENAEGIAALGRASATNLGIANSEFNSLAVSMSAFVDAIAGPGGDVVGIMDDLSTRASDFASVMNLEVSDAFEKFRSGLAGESEPLRRFGIDVSAARVEAFAYANGIAAAGEELTEAEKIQARYGTIMEQTAKVQGDFANTSGELANQTRISNALQENQRAIVGETLQVYREWGNQLSLFSTTLLADLALGIQMVNGNLSEGEFALRRHEIATGQAVTSIQGLVDVVGDYNRRAEEVGFFSDLFDDTKESADRFVRDLPNLIEGLDLTADELLDAVENADSFAHQMGLSADEAEAFEDALRSELNEALNENRTNFGRAGGAAREWRDAQRESAEAVDSHAAALERQREAQLALINAHLEALDPAARAIGAVQRLQEAEAARDETLADSEATAQEVALAQFEYATSLYEAQAALDAFDLGDPEAAVRSFATALRVSNEDARALLVSLGLLDGKVIDITIRTSEITGNQSSRGRTTSLGGRHSGGPVFGGELYRVGEQNQPELLMIPGDNGRVFSNADTRALIEAFRSGGGGGGGDINISIPTSGDFRSDLDNAASTAGLLRLLEVSR